MTNFAGLSAQYFAGQNIRAFRFYSVYEVMGSLEDLAPNQTRVTASVRLAGGMATRSRVKRWEVGNTVVQEPILTRNAKFRYYEISFQFQ